MIKQAFIRITAAIFFGLILSFSMQAMADNHGGPGGQEMGEHHGPQISAEKMEAIRACAAAKGVEMPAPPAKGQMGEKPDHSTPPPHPSAADQAVIDACFEANGVEAPKPPPQGGMGGAMPPKERKGFTEVPDRY